jgi:hypothetical protein
MEALYAVSYGAHFLLKKTRGDAPRVMPLEAQWWVDDPAEQDVLAAVALGKATMADSDRRRWRWRAMIVQADPIDPCSHHADEGGRPGEEGAARAGTAPL